MNRSIIYTIKEPRPDLRSRVARFDMSQLPRIVQIRLGQMTAKQFAEHPDLNLLAAFVEHRLTKEEGEAVVAHLGECADCRQKVAFAAELSRSDSEKAARPKRSWWQALLVLFRIDQQWKLASVALACASLVAVPIFLILHSRPSVERADPLSGLLPSNPSAEPMAVKGRAASGAVEAAVRPAPARSLSQPAIGPSASISPARRPNPTVGVELAISERNTSAGRSLEPQPFIFGESSRLAREGNYEEAIANYQKAIALKPDGSLAYWKLGEALANQGRFSEAEAAIRSSLRLKETSDALQSLSIILMYQSRNAEALPYLRRAFDLEMARGPAAVDAIKKSSLLMYLGIAYRPLNQALATADMFRRGLQVAANAAAENPKKGEAWAFLGYFHAATGDPHRAAMQITTALQLSPEDLTVRKTAVLAYEVLGQRDKTLELLKTSTAEEVAAINRWPDLADLHKDPRFVQLVASKHIISARLSTAQSGSTGTYPVIIKGKVTMEDGSPPPFTVGIERVCSILRRGRDRQIARNESDVQESASGPATNRDGSFIWRMEFDPLRTGSCWIQATHTGYTSSRLEISAINTTPVDTTFTLPPLVIYPELRVSAAPDARR